MGSCCACKIGGNLRFHYRVSKLCTEWHALYCRCWPRNWSSFFWLKVPLSHILSIAFCALSAKKSERVRNYWTDSAAFCAKNHKNTAVNTLFLTRAHLYAGKSVTLPSVKSKTHIMDEKDFRQLSDSEFKAALIATLNLKKEWMASVDKREKELGIR